MMGSMSFKFNPYNDPVINLLLKYAGSEGILRWAMMRAKSGKIVDIKKQIDLMRKK